MGSVDAASFAGGVPTHDVNIDDHVVSKDGKHYLVLNGAHIQFDTRQEAVKFAAFLSEYSGKDLSELSITNLSQMVGNLKGNGQTYSDYLDVTMVGNSSYLSLDINGDSSTAAVYRLTGDFTAQLAKMDKAASGVGSTPRAVMVDGVDKVKETWFADKSKNPELSSEQWRNLTALQLASVASSARELYLSNGFDTGKAATGIKVSNVSNPSAQLRQMVGALFGSDTVDTGHVAVLRAMGLIEQWNQGGNTGTVPSAVGAALLKALGTANTTQPPRLIASDDLDQLPSLATVAGKVNPETLFGGNELLAGKSATDVRNAANTLLGALLPSGFKETFFPASMAPNLSTEAKAVMGKLFGEGAPLSVQKLNAAVMLGLIEVSGANVSATDRGKILIKAPETATTTEPATNKPAADPLGDAQSVEVKLALAFKKMDEWNLTKFFDVGWKLQGGDNEISMNDIKSLSEKGLDFWNQQPRNYGRGGVVDARGQLANVPASQRQDLVNLAKYINGLLTGTGEGQSARNLLMPGEDTATVDRIKAYVSDVIGRNKSVSFDELSSQITSAYLKTKVQ